MSDQDMEDVDDLELQEALRQSLLEVQEGDEDTDSRKRRSSDDLEDERTPRSRQPHPMSEEQEASGGPSSDGQESGAFPQGATEQELLQQAIALSLQGDHSQPEPATASAAQEASSSQPAGYAELAASLQAIMSQHAHQPQAGISGGNPFTGLFSGASPPQATAAVPQATAAGPLATSAQPQATAAAAGTTAAPQQAGSVNAAATPSNQRTGSSNRQSTATQPTWPLLAKKWSESIPDPPRSGSGEPEVAEAEAAAVGATLTQVLGVPVAVQGRGSAGGRQSGVVVVLTPAPGKSSVLGDKTLDMALKSMLSASNLKGRSPLHAMAEIYARATTARLAATDGSVKQAVVARLQQAIVRQALKELMRYDEDDLYFSDGSVHFSHFLTGLASGLISQEFLAALLSLSKATPGGAAVWTRLIRSAFNNLKNLRFTDSQDYANSFAAIDSLFRESPALQHCLVSIMIQEVESIEEKTGHGFEINSTLARLLAVTSIPDTLAILTSREMEVKSAAKEVFTETRTYGRHGEERLPQQSIRHLLWQTYSLAHNICGRLARQKVVQPKNAGREVLLAWLAAAVNKNAIRASKGEKEKVLDIEIIRRGSTDGFSVSVTALCLHFSQWLQKGDDFSQHTGLLKASYYAENPHRWQRYGSMTALTGERIQASEGRPLVAAGFSPDRDPSEAAPHFAAECFFLTQLAMHYCLLPAVNRFSEAQQRLYNLHLRGDPKLAANPPINYRLFGDCTTAQLLDPAFAGEMVKFCYLEAAWLNSLLRLDDDAAKEAFSQVPGFVVNDFVDWLIFVIREGCAELLGGLPTGVLMQAIAGMLMRHDLVGSAVVWSHLVELLLYMLSGAQRQRGGALGRSHMRPAEMQLLSAVYGTGAALVQLVPGLMKCYAAAGRVVGLDVDRDRFDKFGFRNNVAALLMELWKDEGCLQCLTQLAREAAATPAAEVFSGFVSSVLDSLIYLLEDSLQRLGEMHRIEQEKRDEQKWKAAGSEANRRTEALYESQRRTTGGFMGMSWTAISMLKLLAADPVISLAFLEQPLVKRMAYATITFINKLAGPESKQLKVEDPEKLRYDPTRLLAAMGELIARLATSPAFQAAVAQEPDYHRPTMEEARAALAKDNQIDYEIVARLEALMGKVEGLLGSEAPPGLDDAAGASDGLGFAEPEPEDLEKIYQQELGPLQIGTFDSTLPRAYNRGYAEKAESATSNTAATRQQMKRLAKELKGLPDMKMTLCLAGAIFFKHDEDRLDKARVVLVGTEGTPYAGGCFHFDMFFPPDYPNVPPLMELETTGLGRARFHPNLYADGKVCLSLLGTWNSGDESEKWGPHSSIFQIVMSILNQLLVPDPYYAEPNAELAKGTSAGDAANVAYNAQIVLHTVRYAMIDQLKNPRPGFEEITRLHFKLQRHRIMAFCRHWLEEDRGLNELQRAGFKKAVTELHQLLTEL